MSGFTTVQSPGAEIDKDLRTWIAEGTVPGPRILTSLRPINENTGTPEQIREFVRKVDRRRRRLREDFRHRRASARAARRR